MSINVRFAQVLALQLTGCDEPGTAICIMSTMYVHGNCVHPSSSIYSGPIRFFFRYAVVDQSRCRVVGTISALPRVAIAIGSIGGPF